MKKKRVVGTIVVENLVLWLRKFWFCGYEYSFVIETTSFLAGSFDVKRSFFEDL